MGYTKKQFRLLLWKNYFDKGFSLLNNFKYIVVLFGIQEITQQGNYTFTLYLMLGWVIASFFLGWWWYRYGWYSAEIEVGNKINPFVQQMRKKLKV